MSQFTKEERLCSIKLIDELYHNGSSFLLYPYKVTWKFCELPGQFPVQVLISVPRKRFRHAVDRNLLKRRIRESYRLAKEEQLYSFLRQQSKGMLIAFNYVGNEIGQYNFLEKKLLAAIKKLKDLSLSAINENAQ